MADHNRNLTALLDLLVPGDQRWPSASAAGVTAADLEADTDDDTFVWIMSLAAAAAPQLLEIEQREPARFRRMLEAVYRAYYTTQAVQALVVELANAGPREASPYFDKTLVARVIATQAGRRRL
jgi:hypothetical protein